MGIAITEATAETGYRGSVVTPWRQQVAAQRHALAEFILAHADPEEALRVAHDAAHDLGDAVKRHLIARHGRTFDPMFDPPEICDAAAS